MAENMGIPGAETFGDKCGPLLDDLKRKFWEYVLGLHKKLSPSTHSNVPTALDVREDLHISFNDDGFPILPDPPENTPLLKVEMEKLLRTYINEHYS